MKKQMTRSTKKTAFVLGGGVAALGILIGIILLIMSITVIPQGHAGVIYSRSTGVEDTTLPQGWRMVAPNKKVTAYPISTESVNIKEISLATKDGKPLSVDFMYDYHDEVDKLPYIFNKFKGAKPEDIEASFMKARLKEAALSVTSKYTILEVFQKREEIRTDIQKRFSDMLGEHGIILENLTLGTPVPDKSTSKAIQAVVDAQQELEKLAVEKQQATVRAEKARIEAQGKADAILIEAEGQAKANSLLSKSLTPEVVQHHYIEKWDGKEPTTKMSGGSAIVSVPGGK
jgi:prohibitin 1